MRKPFAIVLSFTLLFSFAGLRTLQAQPGSPNIIYVLADDMGYGDASCLNERSKIHTTYIDQLAAGGMKFTDAHSSSSVCTPTRYGILTGRYNWRSSLQSGVLWSYDTALIPQSRLTVAGMLKKKGYHTACIGKWHLGLGWAKDAAGKIDFKQPIANGPVTLGFDYFYGITASLDIPPYFYIQNDRITATSIDTIAGTTGKGFWREGPIGNDFRHIEVLPRMAQKAVTYITEQSRQATPFFLYLPLPAPHTPILPTAAFQGKSKTNAYGDFVLMVDDVVRQVMEAVKKNGIEKNTIIIFASDNGFAPMAGLKELQDLGHEPGYVFRGTKADIYDGGHHIPFIVRWPGKIQAGSTCDTTICLTDFMATCAAIVHFPLPENAGEDSFSLLPLLIPGSKTNYGRHFTIHHSVFGSFAIRQGKWKLDICPGSGGWSHPTPSEAREQALPSVQLYNMEKDISEQHNEAKQHPEIVKKLLALAQECVNNGRSTEGMKQKNDAAVTLFK
jgi:arylsulfatase A-like enzyme